MLLLVISTGVQVNAEHILGKSTLLDVQAEIASAENWTLEPIGTFAVTPNTAIYAAKFAGILQHHMVFQNNLYVMKQGPVWRPEEVPGIMQYMINRSGRVKQHLGLQVNVCQDEAEGVKKLIYLFTKTEFAGRMDRWIHLAVTEAFLEDHHKRMPDPKQQEIWAPPLFVYNYWEK
jgi:hypothetical protein